MEIKNSVFFLDLNLLNKKGDENLKKFAIDEELDVEDIIKIIYNEANRIGEKNNVKVTFKMVDGQEDSFRVIVEPAYIKYKGTVIYPFTLVKSEDIEISLDSVCGKLTLFNRKQKFKKITLTIDFAGLDLFAMSYQKAKEFLVNISDKKCNNGYIEFKDSICFKLFGVKINAQKDEHGNVLENELIKSIDIYNKEEFFNEFNFEQKVSVQKENVEFSSNIQIEPVQEKSNVLEFKTPSVNEKVEEVKIDTADIDIEIPQEENSEQSKTPVNTNYSNRREIEELEKLLKEEQEQQLILEQRIKAKLEELKKSSNIIKEAEPVQEEKKIEQKEIIDSVEIKEPDGYIAYNVVSYEGIKEYGKRQFSVFFGQNKSEIRKYFGGEPKEIRDYEEMELYDIFYVYYDEEDNCTGIGLYNQNVYENKIALYLFGQNLITMKYKDIVKLIKNNDSNAIEDEDGIISLKFGISIDPKETSGYEDKICDVIHIFKKGYYDEVYESFEM